MSGEPSIARPRLAFGLVATLLLATLGEGGGSAIGLAVWHAALGACAIALLLHRRDESATPRYGAPVEVVAALTLFGLLALAGAVRAPYPFAAWLVMLEIAVGCVAFGFAAAVGPELIRVAAWPLRITAALHGATLVAQRLLGGELRPASSFLNPNHAGAWLVLATLVGLGALPERTTPRRLALATAAVSTLGVLVVGSRGAFLALACGLIVLGASLWPRVGRRTRRAAIAAALLLSLTVASAWTIRSRHADPFRYQRLEIWRASAALTIDHPLWGSGPGQFAVLALRYQFPDDDGLLRHDRRFSVTHSDLLRVPAEFGLPATIALLAALVAGGAGIARRRARGELAPWTDGAIAALVAVATQATVDNPSRWSSVALCAVVLAGALTGREPTRRPLSAGWPRTLRWSAAAGVVTLLVVADVAPTLGVGWHGSLPRGRLDGEQLERLHRAARANRLHPEPWRRLAEHELAAPGGMDLAGYARAREAAEAALRRQPADPQYVRTLARVEADACRRLVLDEQTRDRAGRAYAMATELAPRDAVLWLELAVLWLDTGEPSRAAEAARTALTLEPEAIVPRLALAEALIRSGGPQATPGARKLLAEVRSRWSRAMAEARSGAYAATLLIPDPDTLSALVSAVGEPPAPDAAVAGGAAAP